MAFVLSAFADEIGADLELQIEWLKKTGVGFVEYRSSGGKNVSDHTLEEGKAVLARLKDAGLAASDIIYRTDYVDGKLGDNWVLHTDGYFYYDGVLAVGETTDALFDQIVIPFDLTNELSADTEYDIVVKAYAVQAQGARPSFSAVEAMTVEEIAAWFATCGF